MSEEPKMNAIQAAAARDYEQKENLALVILAQELSTMRDFHGMRADGARLLDVARRMLYSPDSRQQSDLAKDARAMALTVHRNLEALGWVRRK
jgi:hypothetical protein